MTVLSISATFMSSCFRRNSNMLRKIGRHEPRNCMRLSAFGHEAKIGSFTEFDVAYFINTD